MGNHRADVAPTARPSTQVTPDAVTPYVGRRRSLSVDEPVVEAPAPSPYVGRRRAATPEPPSAESRESVGSEHAVPTTMQLQALVSRSLDETAPRPRISAPLVEPTTAVVEQRADTLPRLDVPLPRQRGEQPVAFSLPTPAPLFVDDSRTDIPVVGLPADLAADQTVTMPLTAPTSPSGRRRAPGARTGRRRRLPSLPLLAGAASIAIVVTGVATTGQAALAPASSQHLVQASALGGFSASVSVGDHESLSRGGGGRDSIAALLKLRDAALRKGNEQAQVYDDQLAKNMWVLPITAGTYQLTGRFGQVSGLWATVHTGLDFACPTGTPIHAIANGTITFVGWDGPYGNKTVETLADGTEIWYAHQNAFGTQVGATVRQGQVIGYVGSTGNTTGPHVHIEVRPGGGDPVDPDPAFREHGINPDAHQQG